MARALSELSRIAITKIRKADLTANISDEVLVRRILDECDPSFLEELGLALTHQRMVLWIQAERRRVQRIEIATRRRTDRKAG
jgi:hypothetical protein